MKVLLEDPYVCEPETSTTTVGGLTVRMKFSVASGNTPLLATIEIGKFPVSLGVPLSVPVPLPLSVNVSPGGRPLADNDGVGKPVVSTVQE